MNGDSENVQETMKKVSALGNIFIINLLETWNSIYLMNDDMWKQGEQTLLANVQEFFYGILSAEESKRRNLNEQVQNKLTECHKLQSILNLSPQVQVDFDKPLSLILDDLEHKLEEIEVAKQKRMARFELLRSQEIHLCKALTEEVVPISVSIPSEDELKKIELHIFQLEEEKMRRFKIYSQCRKDIEKLITSLEITTLNQLEKNLISKEDSAFPLTAESMTKLNEIKEKYLKNVQENKSLINGLKKSLQKLWDRLNVSKEEQRKFLSTLEGVGCSVKNKLFAELSKWHDKRLAMLAPLADKIREEIAYLCDQLTYTDDQKASLLILEKAPTEELLDLLEQKHEELKVKLNNCSNILGVLKKRNALWLRMVQLEKASLDKSRLSNRGGKLLKEEKERKSVDQDLPKRQHELVQLLTKYQEDNGTPFLYYGKNLLEMVNAEWQARVAEKENLKGKKESTKRKFDVPDSALKSTQVESQDSSVASSSSSASNREAIAAGGVAIFGVPEVHSMSTDWQGSFMVGPTRNLPETPCTPGRTVRSTRTPSSALPCPRTP